ncbi:MAG: hypothetical protein CL927_02515 [Deltaproteobacteria bacterium]|nr:hypothetical protein [Deltaproteobacteria bacterium]HCH65979.1 hypothetical protein [Deltaproteobacteria bacterium]
MYCDRLEVSDGMLQWGSAIIDEPAQQRLTFTNPCAEGGVVRLGIHPSGSRTLTPADGTVPVFVDLPLCILAGWCAASTRRGWCWSLQRGAFPPQTNTPTRSPFAGV